MASKLVAALLALLSGTGLAHAEARFRPGQKWSYHTRAGEENSTVIVLKVEDGGAKVGTIVHIAVEDIKLRTPMRVQTRFPHLPISADALARSVTKLVAERVPLPDFAEGYAQWKQAQGGVFTIPVALILSSVEQAASGAAR
jgi:hypothetical protein